MAPQEFEEPFAYPDSVPIQLWLKVFLANWLHNSDLVESCCNENFFTGDANGTRILHCTQRSLPHDNPDLKCVELSIYTEKGLTTAKPRGHDVPPWERYQLAQPGLENDRSALRCNNIIAKMTAYASSEPKVIYQTMKGNALVTWEAQICRGWTNPRDDKDVMHLALNSWTGENGILDLIKAQAELEALWISVPPHEWPSAVAEGNGVAARSWADVAKG